MTSDRCTCEQEVHEVHAPDLENAVDKPFESRAIGEKRIALEDNPIKAGEHGDDQAGKLGDESHESRAMAFSFKVLRVSTTPFLKAERRFSYYLLVAALPR